MNLEATSCRRMVCPLVQERSALTAIEESSRGSRVTLVAMDIKRRLEPPLGPSPFWKQFDPIEAGRSRVCFT